MILNIVATIAIGLFGVFVIGTSRGFRDEVRTDLITLVGVIIIISAIWI